jgi:hypothetical protein
MEDLDTKEDLSYQEYTVRIFETSERVTWNKRINSARCNGVTIPRKKLHGKGKKC